MKKIKDNQKKIHDIDCNYKSHNHIEKKCHKLNADNNSSSNSNDNSEHLDENNSSSEEKDSSETERLNRKHSSVNEDFKKDNKNIFIKIILNLMYGIGFITHKSLEILGLIIKDEGYKNHHEDMKKTSSKTKVTNHDSDHSHNHAQDSFQTKIWILILGAVLAIFAFWNLLDELITKGDLLIPFLGIVWVQFTFATIIFIIMGIAFVKGSVIALSKKKLSEDLLVAIATMSAYIYSIGAMIYNNNNNVIDLDLFFYEGIEIWVLIYLGRFIEEWLVNKVSKEMNSLESLKPKSARVLRKEKEFEININKVVLGDIVVIKPGEVIPIDGMVIFGETSIDESSLTGESLPINKEKGSSVFGGTISSNGLIHVEVKKLIGDSFISKIIDGIKEATATKPKTQRIADKIAAILIPAVLLISIITFTIYLLIDPSSANNLSGAIVVTITILIIACPCSFAMTTPMSVLMASTTSKREGVIFNSKNIFEMIKKIDIIAFDKTGTLTEGKFNVIGTTIPKDILSIVVSAEKSSNHPLANSIVKNITDIEKIDVIVKEVIGKGIKTTYKNNQMYVGSLKFLQEKIASYVESEEIIYKRDFGSAFIYAFSDNKVYGYIELKDEVKETTIKTLAQLRYMGIDVVMITGDHKNTANHIGSKLGIDESLIYSEVLPSEKSKIIKELQKKGRIVGFVGDGINDSIALIQADLGFAIGEGSDAAIESADIILNKNDMTLISYSIWLSRKTLFNIHRGFGIAIVYNIFAIPIAALGIITPAFGALSMIFNDSVAMINAMTLSNKMKKKFDKKNEKRLKKLEKNKK